MVWVPSVPLSCNGDMFESTPSPNRDPLLFHGSINPTIFLALVSHQKILRETDYWDDLFLLLDGRKVRLYLTGPEMSGKDGVFKTGRKEGQEDVRITAVM